MKVDRAQTITKSCQREAGHGRGRGSKGWNGVLIVMLKTNLHDPIAPTQKRALCE